MTSFIGMDVDEATRLIKDSGYSVEVVMNSSEKCKVSDSVLVTNAKLVDGTYHLTVSPFLLDVASEE